MGMTFAEKILAGRAGLDKVAPGQIVIVEPDHLLTHDNTAAIVGKIGEDLDRFSRFDFGLFGSSTVAGYQNGLVRADEAAGLHMTGSES